jgi:hypothetical protein
MLMMWIHQRRGHVQESGSFFDDPQWRQPVNCSCGKTWYF